jgi:predicted GIY-YIG superfamily endonuclease
MNYKIYKLTNDEGLIYIGSTKLDLDKRFIKHKSSFKRYVNNKIDIYYTAYEVLRGTNPRIECIEELGNITKNEARTKETNYIKDLNCVNKNKAIITLEEKSKKM